MQPTKLVKLPQKRDQNYDLPPKSHKWHDKSKTVFILHFISYKRSIYKLILIKLIDLKYKLVEKLKKLVIIIFYVYTTKLHPPNWMVHRTGHLKLTFRHLTLSLLGQHILWSVYQNKYFTLIIYLFFSINLFTVIKTF